MPLNSRSLSLPITAVRIVKIDNYFLLPLPYKQALIKHFLVFQLPAGGSNARNLKKLNYKSQSPVLVLDAPSECTALVQELSAVAEVHTGPQKNLTYDFCLAFCPAKKDLLENAARMHNNYGANAIIWFCYPKQTAPHYTSDLNRDRCWQYLEPYDLVPVRQVTIDDDWSALRYRREQPD